MNIRNLVVAGLSLSAAAAAVVAGAIVSGNAMASSDDGPLTASITIVSQQNGQDPVSCSFTDVPLQAAVTVSNGEAPVGAPLPDGATQVTGQGGLSVQVGGQSGSAVAPDGTLPLPPAGAISGSITVGVGSGSVDGPVPALPLPGNLQTARAGTAEECAALRQQFNIGVAALPATAPSTTVG